MTEQIYEYPLTQSPVDFKKRFNRESELDEFCHSRLHGEVFLINMHQQREIEKINSTVEAMARVLRKVMEEQTKAIVFEFKQIPFEDAKLEVISFLKDAKSKKIPTETIFGISQKLRLPANQIEEVLEELSKEKKISF